MKLTIQHPVQSRVEGFFEYLKERTKDPEHIGNHDVIAEFVDKFLVVELKRLAITKENYEETIEIPNDVLLEPLRKAKEQLDETFEAMLKGGGKTRPAMPAESSIHTGQTDVVEETVQIEDGSIQTRKVTRNGNGHKSLKKRDLTGAEKDEVRSWFMGMNGCVADDNCTSKHRSMQSLGSPDISVFQVTGFATYLHYQVAGGTIILQDMDKYWEFMKLHYSKLYNSPKYQAKLAASKNPPAPKLTTPAGPKFASGFPTKSAI